MLKVEKIKPTINYLVDILVRLKLRKTYWGVVSPLIIFMVPSTLYKFGAIDHSKFDSFVSSEEPWRTMLKILQIYLTFEMPTALLVFTFLLFLILTAVYLYELKVKDAEREAIDMISAQQVENRDKLKKIDQLISERAFEASDVWFVDQCTGAIKDLGPRYTPKLHIALEASKIMNGLSRNTNFKKEVDHVMDKLLVSGKNALNRCSNAPMITELSLALEELKEVYTSVDLCGVEQIPVESFTSKFTAISVILQKLESFYSSKQSKDEFSREDRNLDDRHREEIRSLNNFRHNIETFIELIESPVFQLANNPYLLLSGEAGIGKSHLLADAVTTRMSDQAFSILLLGQHFTTEEDPWTQIRRVLKIETTVAVFLNQLNEFAKRNGKRVIIFIDAINEGKGRFFWKNFLSSFFHEIQGYQCIGVVMSIRTSYIEAITTDAQIAEINLFHFIHTGFENVEYDATSLYFNNYNIALPSIPMLFHEFKNPLFLKLFCEAIAKGGGNKVPDGLQGFTDIINTYLRNVNSIIASSNRYDYSSSLPLVSIALDALIAHKLDKELYNIEYVQAYRVVTEAVDQYIERKGFIDELVREGVLSKNEIVQEDGSSLEIVYLAYERFEDYLTAHYLIKKLNNVELAACIEKLAGNVHDTKLNRGVLEAMSIILPELKGKELFEYTSGLQNDEIISRCFINSLLWRKYNSIDDTAVRFIQDSLLGQIELRNALWEIFVNISIIPAHPLNVDYFSIYLNELNMAQRDAQWIPFLSHRYRKGTSLWGIVDWSWGGYRKITTSRSSIGLACKMLCWFLASSNRKLRDHATKALTVLLRDNPEMVIPTLEAFNNIDDPYILERQLAAVYGSVVFQTDTVHLLELAQYLYQRFFSNPKNVPIHILTRDYLRGTMEFIEKSSIESFWTTEEVQPPYRSDWPTLIPSWSDLQMQYDNDGYRHLWQSVMGFEDFARYIIGTNSDFSDWSGAKVGETLINKKVIEDNFIKKLTKNQRNLYRKQTPLIVNPERSVLHEDMEFKFNTVIGRKTEEEITYAKEVFESSLDNEILQFYLKEVKPFLDHNQKIRDTAENFDSSIAQRFIFSRAISLGYDPELHLKFDTEIGVGRARNTLPNERIGKKYQWIAYHEYLALMSDNYKMNTHFGRKSERYEGPWDPFVRDIDPTLLLYNVASFNDSNKEPFWWFTDQEINFNVTDKEWISEDPTKINIENLISIADTNNEQWLVLEGYPKWNEPKGLGEDDCFSTEKELWIHLRSYITKTSHFNAFKDWADKSDFMGRWMYESNEQYEIYNREYYWSSVYESFAQEGLIEKHWHSLMDDSSKFVADINVTAEGYLSEHTHNVHNKDTSIRFLKPSRLIFEGMKLQHGMRDGEFINSMGEVVCFATNVHHNSKSFLLIKKEPFEEFLNRNNLKILWTVLGEKQILGNFDFTERFKRLVINGAYELTETGVSGQLRSRTS